VKILVVGIAAVCVVALGGCRTSSPMTVGKDLVCAAAKAWLAADPAHRAQATDAVRTAVDTAEHTTSPSERTGPMKTVLDAARAMVSGAAEKSADIAQKIAQNC